MTLRMIIVTTLGSVDNTVQRLLKLGVRHDEMVDVSELLRQTLVVLQVLIEAEVAQGLAAIPDRSVLNDADFAQTVLFPLSFRLHCRKDAGENVAIGQPLRRDLEHAMNEAADRLICRPGEPT